jgi:hypothetical protein
MKQTKEGRRGGRKIQHEQPPSVVSQWTSNRSSFPPSFILGREEERRKGEEGKRGRKEGEGTERKGKEGILGRNGTEERKGRKGRKPRNMTMWKGQNLHKGRNGTARKGCQAGTGRRKGKD